MPATGRRATLRPRVRPLTSAGELATPVWTPHQDGSYREAAVEAADTVAVLPQPKHRQSKSFSSIRHGASELKTITRGLSMSLRSKGRRSIPDNDTDNTTNATGEDDANRAGWFRNHKLPRRRSLGGLGNLHRLHAPVPCPPMPAHFREMTDAPTGGAAARAAAAAQNEMARKTAAAAAPKRHDEGMELASNLGAKLSLASESGIGFSIRDADENDLNCVRKDPILLPAELMAHVLSFLDADSLKRAELVSRAWHQHASSSSVWRQVFYREYHGDRNLADIPGEPKRATGLGRRRPGQNWKKVYRVRHTLENRWKAGKAAAIYLHGHQDSIYCLQFDENKIITGSRDRTIRVWDAHYPWPCLKVIGALQPSTDSSAPVSPWPITPPADSTGSAPFISICPPVTSPAALAACAQQPGEYHNASILCLQFDDRIMVTGSSDATCIVWDVQDDYRPIRRLAWHQSGVLDVCFNDKYIVSCSKDTTICVWDRETGQLLKRLLGHRGPVNAVRVRGDLVVSASGDGMAKLWNISSGLCIKEFTSRDRGLACVEFSEDARTILAGGNDQVIYQFDANTGELVRELDGHDALVRSLHMDLPNGRIVSSSYDRSIKVFDVKEGELSVDLPGWTTSWILGAKSDYRRIVATSQDARAVIIDFGYGIDGIESLQC